MFYTKAKSYKGRWLLKLLEAALIFGIVFFGLDALGQWANNEVADPEASAVAVQPVIIETTYNSPETAFDAEDYFTRALQHQYVGDYYEAIADYSRAIELDSDLSASWLNRGVAYEQAQNKYRAMSDFSRFLMRDGMTIISLSTIQESHNEVVEMAFNYRYDFPLALRAGQVVNIRAVSVEEDLVDPIIVLLNDAGNPVDASDDVLRQDGSLIAMNSYINNYTVSRSGRYTLQVSHAGGGYFGDIEVSINIDN